MMTVSVSHDRLLGLEAEGIFSGTTAWQIGIRKPWSRGTSPGSKCITKHPVTVESVSSSVQGSTCSFPCTHGGLLLHMPWLPALIEA